MCFQNVNAPGGLHPEWDALVAEIRATDRMTRDRLAHVLDHYGAENRDRDPTRALGCLAVADLLRRS
jgi:hypothetical protein